MFISSRFAAALLFLLAIITLIGANIAHAGDWPHWRGPTRNGVSPESSHWNGKTWLSREPAWSRNFGAGTTSPLVVDGRLYVMGSDRRQDTLYCVNAATGKEIWKVAYACPLYGRRSAGDKGFYSGPSSTPEFDAGTGFLYTLSIDGDLNCWDTSARGRKVWGFNLYQRYAPPMRPRVGRSGRRDYGFTSSPLVQGDSIIVEVGGQKGNLIGFDKRTGQERWRSQAKDPAGHNGGPTPIIVEGVPCVAVLNHNGLLVARLDQGREGQTVAQYPWRTGFANNIASPTVHGQYILITSGYNQAALCKLKITLKGAEKAWQVDAYSKVCSPIVHKDRVYWVWRDLYCLDWETGKLVWRQRGSYSDAGSCIVTRDDRLIVWAKSGRLLLAETAVRAPRQPKILAQRDGIFRHDVWPHVVLSKGRLYCKDKLGNLKCFKLTP